MIGIVGYLLTVTIAYSSSVIFLLVTKNPDIEPYKTGLICAFVGGFGGCVYCTRAVYLNVAVRKSWNSDWYVWYFLRPLVSVGCGGISFMFLKAGLLILEARTQHDSNDFGFYALSFLAGYNVDKFLKKLEDVGEAVFGIEKSRSAAGDETKERIQHERHSEPSK